MSLARFAKVSLTSIAMLLVLGSTGCGGSGGGDGTESPAASGAVSGCDEVNALKSSLTALTQVNPVSDGTDALRSAAAEVKTNLDAAESAVASDLKPAVDQVRTAFGDLETALQGVSSGGGLGAAAGDVVQALTKLGSALTALSSEISTRC